MDKPECGIERKKRSTPARSHRRSQKMDKPECGIERFV